MAIPAKRHRPKTGRYREVRQASGSDRFAGFGPGRSRDYSLERPGPMTKRGNQTEGPRRGKEVPSHEPLKGNMPGTLRPEPCPRNDDGSRGSRIHEMRNRVRVMCKPGSVGGLG